MCFTYSLLGLVLCRKFSGAAGPYSPPAWVGWCTVSGRPVSNKKFPLSECVALLFWYPFHTRYHNST